MSSVVQSSYEEVVNRLVQSLGVPRQLIENHRQLTEQLGSPSPVEESTALAAIYQYIMANHTGLESGMSGPEITQLVESLRQLREQPVASLEEKAKPRFSTKRREITRT
jgi:hypothetical protein